MIYVAIAAYIAAGIVSAWLCCRHLPGFDAKDPSDIMLLGIATVMWPIPALAVAFWLPGRLVLWLLNRIGVKP